MNLDTELKKQMVIAGRLASQNDLEKFKLFVEGSMWAFRTISIITEEMITKVQFAEVSEYTKNGAKVFGQELLKQMALEYEVKTTEETVQ